MSAQITASLCRDVDHVGVFLWRRVSGVFASQLEIHLRRFVRENLLIVERCFDLAIYKQDHFVIGDGRVAYAILAIRIRADDLLEIASVFGGDVDFSAGNWLLTGILNDALNPGRPGWGGPSGNGGNEQDHGGELERFDDHNFFRFS